MAGSNAIERSSDHVAALLTWSCHILAVLLWLTAATFLWRRLARALVQPLSLPVSLAVALAVTTVAVTVRIAWRHRVESTRRRRFLEAGTSIAVLGLAVALSLPGTSVPCLILLWAVFVIEEIWTWRRHSYQELPLSSQSLSLPASLGSTPQAAPAPSCQPGPPATELALAEPVELPPASEIVQQLLRMMLPDGSEQLTGWLRVPLASGQRSANLHLAFCPPFARTPRVTVDQRDGPAARIKPVQLLPFGARFDLKLAQPCDRASAVVLYVRADSAPAIVEEGGQQPQKSPDADGTS